MHFKVLFLFIFRSSQRLLYVFRSTDLSASLNTLNLDVSPTLLVPYYDEDSSTLFLTGKVSSTSIPFDLIAVMQIVF